MRRDKPLKKKNNKLITMEKFYIKASKWQDFSFDLDNQILIDIHILRALNSFWTKKVSKMEKANSIQIQFKIQIAENVVRSVSYIQTVTINEKNKLFEIFKAFWEIRHDDYHVLSINSIIFTYRVVEPYSAEYATKISGPKNKLISLDNRKEASQNFLGFNLPSTMDLQKWGEVKVSNDLKKVEIIKLRSKIYYTIDINEKIHNVKLNLEGRELFSFKDQLNDSLNLGTFTRVLNGQKYDYINGKIVLKQKICQIKFMDSIQRDLFKNSKYLTLDLETRTLNGVMEPYCVSIYDGKEIKSFYVLDFENGDEMLRNAIYYLMKRKYDGYKVYIHNFSYFDAIFMIKTLSDLSDNIKPVIRDGRIIDLRFKFNLKNSSSNKNYTLYFRDSYLMLPSSLSKLAKQLKVENKSIFPYQFVNQENVSLDYIGKTPELKYFNTLDEIAYEEYFKSYLDSNWNLREETIRYCEQDVKTLYQVISKFSLKIFDLFRLNVHRFPTLSSLALGIFRSNYNLSMNQSKIPLITGKIYQDIKKGYTGGSVDSFKPQGKNIYQYDVNSLYPYVMSNFPMPVGVPTYFEGDIFIKENRPFGIFEVEVESPLDLNVPILQTKFKTTNGGVRTITPLGKWVFTYFSEEIYNAMDFGYKFKILRGYIFEKGYIFKDYVETLYNLKSTSEKNSPDYIISKLLLNSLYGRLGMEPEALDHLIKSSELLHKYYAKFTIANSIDLKNGKELISYWNKDKISSDKNISVPISLAVTAYGRIHMAQLKMNLISAGYTIYYSDTDSLFLDKPLENKYLGEELGQMKTENIFKEAVFLCPKVYGGITLNDEEHIKIKGVKSPIPYSELKTLLKKDTKLEINQEKWYRDFSNAKISVKDEVYSLIATENKRISIYNDQNEYINTKPIFLSR